MKQPDERVDIPAATARQGRPAHVIYHLIRTGRLPSEKVRVPGRDGRHVLKHLIRINDLDALDRPLAHEEHVAAIRAAATPWTETQIKRIRRALERSWP